MTKQLRRKVALRHAIDAEIDQLIVQARSQERPVEYSELEEITGLSREWLRRIVNGTAPAKRPRRRTRAEE